MMATRHADLHLARVRARAINLAAILALVVLVAVAASEWAAFSVTRAVVASELGRMP